MIFSSMEYPGKDYRVQVVDTWLGEEFEPMDNPKNGDKIVYRVLGENGQPVEQKTEIYEDGAWVEQGGGGSTSLYTDCVVTLNKTAGVSGYSVVALPSVEKNPNAPTYGIVGVCIYTDGSWSGGSYTCPLYDGNLTIFITAKSGDIFQVASGDATTSVDGKEVYVHGDCTIDIISDK